MKAVVVVAALLALASAKTYFEETFDDASWEDRWVVSKSKSDYGEWKWGPGQWFANEAEAKGLYPSQGLKFYAITSKIAEPFSNKGKDLILQFTAKYEKNEYSFCGGGYIKLLPATLNPLAFNGDSEYDIMFGPDRCGYDVSRIHAIFGHDGKNLLKKDDIKLEYNDKNEFTHLYTFVIHSDNTYEVFMDQTSKSKGALHDHWGFEPKQIDDPTDKKPSDWVDEAKIPDPTDKKPEGYDDIPKQIPDPSAEKPDDWNEEEDGEWEPPMIDNPEYKGEWKAKMIDNPAYKGVWKAKQIDNPKYEADVYAYDNIGYVGLDLWIVNDGTIFDNILVTDSKKEADAHADKHWAKIKEGEKEAKEAFDKAKKDAEEKTKKADEDDDDADDDEKDEL